MGRRRRSAAPVLQVRDEEAEIDGSRERLPLRLGELEKSGLDRTVMLEEDVPQLAEMVRLDPQAMAADPQIQADMLSGKKITPPVKTDDLGAA